MAASGAGWTQNGGSKSSGNMWPETKKFSVLMM